MAKQIKVVEKWNNQEYDCTIEKNKSIQIDCFYKNSKNPKQTSVKFNVGDTAEYDSYNLKYLGTIVSITEKTVTIKESMCEDKHRLSLEKFCWRNWDFNLEATLAYNSEERMYI